MASVSKVGLGSDPTQIVNKQCNKCKIEVVHAFIRCVKCDVMYHKSCLQVMQKRNKKCTVLSDNEMICDQHGIEQESPVVPDITAFLNNGNFFNVLNDSILRATAPLVAEVEKLRQEVNDLKSSNIDLVRLLTDFSHKHNTMRHPSSTYGTIPEVSAVRSFKNSQQLKQHNHQKLTTSTETNDHVVGNIEENHRIEEPSQHRLTTKSTETRTSLYRLNQNNNFPDATKTELSPSCPTSLKTSTKSSLIIDTVPIVDDTKSTTSEKQTLTVDTVQDDFHEVLSRKFKRKFLRGKAKLPEGSTSLKAAPGMSHIYIGNVELNVRCEDLVDYLKGRFPNEEVIIKALPKRENAKSKAFQISVASELYTSLMKEEIWPTGIVIKKFHFLSGKKKETITGGNAQMNKTQQKETALSQFITKTQEASEAN
ncbi:hypothetical protein Zmor_024458 [Zophobas morio]|uniref:Uncharacterized protein n=1 Tax=Zophobas morio TaxID=2755281 RepID=A0AA38M826_9CUCU|nr:hypothetical protein Zmor_024458 [Zophobas morio]